MGMRIQIGNEDSNISRLVYNEYGTSEEVTWSDALKTFFEMLQGIGFSLAADPEEYVDAIRAYHDRKCEELYCADMKTEKEGEQA